jgi:DNA-binding HxlR family transcriptional regulator
MVTYFVFLSQKMSGMEKKEMVEISEKCKALTVGLRDTQELLKGKWKVMILQALYFGKSLNFSDLKYYLPKISSKVLSQDLKDLESNFLIVREEFETFPPSVVYKLSLQGSKLFDVINVMSEYGYNYRKELFNKE